MKILQCSDSYLPHPGGVSEHLHYLSVALRRRGHNVTILAPEYPERYEDPSFVKRIGRVVYFKGNKSTITFTFHPLLPYLVNDFIRKENFEIVHTHGPFGWNLPYWAFHLSRGLNVATLHTTFTGFNFYSLAKLFFKREFQRRMDGLIFVSKTAFESAFPHFPLNYKIIPNGIDTERFSPRVKPIISLKKKGTIILFVGRLDERKGLNILLKAFPIIKKRIPYAVLVVVGKGPLMGEFKKMVPHQFSNDVIFEGFVSEEKLPSYYTSADVYCSPSTGGETFGIVLLEGMASGIPVVASNIPGYDQVIIDGYNGIFFETGNHFDLAEKIITVIKKNKLREKLITGGLKTSKKFSWEEVALQVENYYLELMERRKERQNIRI